MSKKIKPVPLTMGEFLRMNCRECVYFDVCTGKCINPEAKELDAAAAVFTF